MSPISLLYARAYIHSTEDPVRVIRALKNVVEGRYAVKTAVGHYKNLIHIVEIKLVDWDAFEALKSIISRLDDVEFTLFLSGAEKNRLYVKFDKQHAYRGLLRVSRGDDVIFLEVRSRSLVVDDMRQLLSSLKQKYH
ncbi:MAG: RNA-binding domain-containing protein [Pyrobaculum sp.]